MNYYKFVVIAEDIAALTQTIARYNAAYGTDFAIVDHQEDEVLFVTIGSTVHDPVHLFGLGYQCSQHQHYLASRNSKRA